MGHQKINRAMILAAGLGTRLAPITKSIPKPLVPVLNIPNIVHSLYLLKRAGISHIIINTFHLGDQISDYLQSGALFGVDICYSPEEVLLGTGGGVKKAEDFFDNKPFVLCNSDFISDMAIEPLIEEHFKSKSLASMVLIDDEEKKKRYAPVGTTKEGLLCSLPTKEYEKPSRTGFFTGLHILESEALCYLEPEPSGINRVLYPALMEERPDLVRGLYTECDFWKDAGEIPELFQSSMFLLEEAQKPNSITRPLLESSGYKEKLSGVWVHPTTQYEPKKEQAPMIVGKHCEIDSKAEIGPHTVIGDNCTISAGAKAHHCCLLPGAQIAKGETISQCLYFDGQPLR